MSVQVILPPEEYAEDLELRLGRANGNIYHRIPGVEGVHDGQVMVRLKKKRFVILDYSIIPNENDFEAARGKPYISLIPGAGKTSCTNADCNKVGVPVLLYDSDPAEPPSLYIRSGLCFTCQRNLNEKRRTQRKRPTDSGLSARMSTSLNGDGSVTVFGSTSIPKKFKMSPGAIIIHPMEGLRALGDGYGFGEIGIELHRVVGDISTETQRLLDAVSPHHHHHTHHQDPTGALQPDFAATAAAVAASVGVEPGGLSPVDDLATNAAMDAASAANHVATDGHKEYHHHHHEEPVPELMPTATEDISALYDKAYRSMNRGVYLLCQWKQSWDSAIAAAVVQESVDHGLADAVASAAAVAAAAADTQDENVSALLMPVNKDDAKKSDDAVIAAAEAAVADATEAVVEAFAV